ncbi:MAG: HAMP domain-containing histidine kinase [Streptococcaceae bacterium]|jgi:signal transduction histidine kinase|nr:HAMP domain-containing histidine kinase [Streptococcaceae bacterium]
METRSTVAAFERVFSPIELPELTPTNYLVFVDTTAIFNEIKQLQRTLLNSFWLMIIVVLLLSFLLSILLTRPIKNAMEKQRRFITDASHELKTPLTIMKSNYEVLLLEKEETIQTQIEWLENMKFGIERMSSLTNNLLALSQIEQTSNKSQYLPINVHSIVQEIILPLNSRMNEKNIRFCIDMKSGLVLNTQKEEFSQLLLILLDNAVKYTNFDGWIEISVKKMTRKTHISISNSGAGITANDLPFIFDRFYRVDASRTYANESFGLGLSIAKEITGSLNGKLKVYSKPDEKTTFTIIL